MFYYNEYDKYFVQQHIIEKTKFYCYKYLVSLKSIIVLIKYISLRYSIAPRKYKPYTHTITNLLFYGYLNRKLRFIHRNKKRYCYNIHINNDFIYKYNMFYTFFLLFIFNTNLTSCLMELNKVESSCYSYLKISFNKFITIPSTDIYLNGKNTKAISNLTCKTNSSNHYINKLFMSHTFLNIL